jgi:hypothetical protein
MPPNTDHSRIPVAGGASASSRVRADSEIRSKFHDYIDPRAQRVGEKRVHSRRLLLVAVGLWGLLSTWPCVVFFWGGI